MADHFHHSSDIPFKVSFVHRLRETMDVSGRDRSTLSDLLDRGDTQVARVLLITERAVASASAAPRRIEAHLKQCDFVDLSASMIVVDGGESIKNSSETVEKILAEIHEANLDRRSYVIAIGGGAMLDAVGYASSIAHRGIRLIRLPTTTLAQADSGVGVKNAINYFDKKNWVGTFAVPWAVVNDWGLLSSLPDRDFHCGFSEAVKVSLLKDRDEFHWLAQHSTRIFDREEWASRRAIRRSCQLHLKHITEGGDPFEMLEARPLDFGHWSAHKLESLTRFSIGHGEAVAIGVAIDCLYSAIKFGFPMQDAERAIECMSEMGMHLWHQSLEPVNRLLEGLEEFRQHLGGRLTITMLQDVGQPINVHEIDADAMKKAIEMLHVHQHSKA